MRSKVLSAMSKYNMVDKEAQIIAGVSGGADSMAMLHILHTLKHPVIAVHVNHGIRAGESARDEAFVTEACGDLGIPVRVYRENVPEIAARKGISTEEAGREVRYECFRDAAKGLSNYRIAVAHNLNDQAETLAMRFIRGAGGMKGIPAVRGSIIRPLLEITRAEIEAYCMENQIGYVTDSTNLAAEYTRNKIRLQLIPYIEQELNPGFVRTAGRNAIAAARDEDYLAIKAKKLYEDALLFKDSGRVELESGIIEKGHPALKARALRMAIENLDNSLKDISFSHVEAILGLIHAGQTGKQVDIAKGMTATLSYGKLVLGRISRKSNFCFQVAYGAPYFLEGPNLYAAVHVGAPDKKLNCLKACTKVFTYDKIIDDLTIRSRLPGDRIFLSAIGGHKKIKDYLIDKKVPRAHRDQIPLLAHGSEIIYIFDQNRILSDKYKTEAGAYQYFIQLWEA